VIKHGFGIVVTFLMNNLNLKNFVLNLLKLKVFYIKFLYFLKNKFIICLLQQKDAQKFKEVFESAYENNKKLGDNK